MKIENTLFDEVKILSFGERKDIRGDMAVAFDESELRAAGIDFVCKEQRIYTMPNKGTFFGIHFQLKSHPQDKLIRLISGKGMDYIVDLRRSSKTYKQWTAAKLSGGDGRCVYIPQGFGHAFLSLEDNTVQLFTVSEHFDVGASKQINYSDPAIGLEFPTDILHISDSDRSAPFIDSENYDV